jgi:dTDP-4-amino-4,6-dideoxygalactose transaminase
MSVIIKKDLDIVRQRLRDAGIQTSKHYDLIPEFTNFRGSGFENHIALLKNLLTLPLYPHLSDEDISYIGSVING